MTTKQITIRMPEAKLRLWLRALRLKKNAKRQAKGALWVPKEKGYSNGGYCCLGVAQQVLSGGVETMDGGGLEDCKSFPSYDWQEGEGIEFFDKHGTRTRDPYLPLHGVTASYANDTEGLTFAQIADAIEDCAEGY